MFIVFFHDLLNENEDNENYWNIDAGYIFEHLYAKHIFKAFVKIVASKNF